MEGHKEAEVKADRFVSVYWINKKDGTPGAFILDTRMGLYADSSSRWINNQLDLLNKGDVGMYRMLDWKLHSGDGLKKNNVLLLVDRELADMSIDFHYSK